MFQNRIAIDDLDAGYLQVINRPINIARFQFNSAATVENKIRFKPKTNSVQSGEFDTVIVTSSDRHRPFESIDPSI